MKHYIFYHLKKYPLMTTQDVVKLLYQSFFGNGHFITNEELARKRFSDDLNNKHLNFENIYEYINEDFIRVNIFPYILYFDKEHLINYFINNKINNNDLFPYFIKSLNEIDNDGFLDNYNYESVHHSKVYQTNYLPNYRVVDKGFLDLQIKIMQLNHYLNNLNGFNIVSLEGKCASGKTTISSNLSNITVIDIDDFFLSKKMKSVERLNEIGGNIDYLLLEECLKKIEVGKLIKYKVFDCSKQEYYYKETFINNTVLLCGVYSYHQHIRKYINKLIYLLVDKDTQDKRLKERPNYVRFVNEWVPLEEKYYDSFDFLGNADLLI